MQQPHTLLLAALVLSGCVIAPSHDQGAGSELVTGVHEADDIVPGGALGLDAECISAGDHVANNGPSHEDGVCAEGGGFTLQDAIAACGGTVKYFSTDCTDFPPTLPYQPEPQRAWTTYFGCCASSSPGYSADPGPDYGVGPGYGAGAGYGPGFGHGPGSGHGPATGYGPEPGYGAELPPPPLR